MQLIDRRTVTRLALPLLMLCALVVGVPAEGVAQEVVYKSGIDTVSLTVTVTDGTGHYITGLTGRDFAVFEDGAPQALSFFASERVPIDVALVLDTSASMAPDMPLVRKAASGLICALREGDRGAVLAVSSSVAMPQGFTADHDRVVGAIRTLSAAGTTALYDGLYVAMKEFTRERREHSEVRRQVLVLLSDGLDNASHIGVDDVTDLARRTNVAIYVVALGAMDPPSGARWQPEQRLAQHTMRTFAHDAGGRIFFPTTAADLPGIYDAIARELASQYDLGYVPAKPGGDGAFRRIAVRIVPPSNGVARARSGYYAVRPPGRTDAPVREE
jgi:Ca-activated chloride channel family protein